jgi:hypothetical protein
VDDGDGYILPPKIVVKAGAATNQFIDFTRKFYATEAGTDNDEAEVPTALIGVCSSLRMLHLMDDMLAEIDGISHDLKAKRMVGHSWDDTQVAFRATGNHQMVVVQD